MSERNRNDEAQPGTAGAVGVAGEAGQLRLLPGTARRTDWELDERTRRVGRRGVAEAREILRRAHRPEPAPSDRKAS